MLTKELKGKYYWYALRRAYDGSDNLFEHKAQMRLLFSKEEEGREHLMSLKERRFLENLPDEITIYRGMTKKEFRSKKFGVSWTLKESVADFFAYKYWRNVSTNHLEKCVHSVTINKKDVLAFFDERKEYEIIYLKKS